MITLCHTNMKGKQEGQIREADMKTVGNLVNPDACNFVCSSIKDKD